MGPSQQTLHSKRQKKIRGKPPRQLLGNGRSEDDACNAVYLRPVLRRSCSRTYLAGTEALLLENNDRSYPCLVESHEYISFYRSNAYNLYAMRRYHSSTISFTMAVHNEAMRYPTSGIVPSENAAHP